MKLSIIILNWNTSDLLQQTLASVYKETAGFDYEVIVVDNASSDYSVEKVRQNYPQARVIVNEGNIGFSKGNNVGLKVAQGEYLMLLNSDVIVRDGAINQLVKFLDEHPEAVMVGPRLINSDGSFQASCRRKLPNPWNSFVYLFGLKKLIKAEYKSDSRPEAVEETEGLSGAAMMFRRQVYETIGGLDEDFFMYGEDLDFCFRVKEKVGRIFFVGTAVITHLYGQSSAKRKVDSIVNFYDAMVLYYKKHFWRKHGFLFDYLVICGIKFRLMIALIQNYLKRK